MAEPLATVKAVDAVGSFVVQVMVNAFTVAAATSSINSSFELNTIFSSFDVKRPKPLFVIQ
jgi:hypothetical protein